MDIFDVIEIMEDTYNKSKKSKIEDPIELFFDLFSGGKKKIEDKYNRDMEEYNKREKERRKELDKILKRKK